MSDMGKWRLRCPKSSIVDKTTSDRIYLSLHLLCESLWLLLRSSLKEVNLSRFGAIRMPQTFLTQLAYAAVGLSPMKFDGPLAINYHIAPITV